MGKKPVVAVVGLIWAGMVLVGCENCKNCRKKYDPAPTFGAKADAPVAKQDATATPSVVTPTATAGAAAVKPETGKAVDPLGTKGFETPAVGTPVSTGSPPPSGIQSSLSPNTDGRPVVPPGQGTNYLSGETPVSKSPPIDIGSRVPPRPPISPVGASVPSGLTETLPPISPQSALPHSPYEKGGLSQPPTMPTPTGGLPQPPVSPMPSAAGNGLPGIDSAPK